MFPFPVAKSLLLETLLLACVATTSVRRKTKLLPLMLAVNPNVDDSLSRKGRDEEGDMGKA